MTDLFQGHDETGVTPREARARRAQQRRRTKARRRKNLVSFLIMVLALLLLVGGAVIFVRPLLQHDSTPDSDDYPGPGTGAVEVVIGEGDSGAAIGSTLVEADVVKTVDAFKEAYAANPNSVKIQPGTYELPTQMRATDAIAALLDTANRTDTRLTVPEGFTVAQIYERIANVLGVSQDDVEQAGEDLAADLPDEAGGSLEGWLAPSTFNLEPDDTPANVLTQMYRQTIRNLDDADVPEDERADTLVRASIVEKEVPAAADDGEEGADSYRPRVARVIQNRLDGCSGDGRLGMDTTYAYRLGVPAGQISNDQWREDDPYNGRRVAGLPPTAIASPSVDAIDAVRHPDDGTECYFVTVNLETGETLFADTKEEHEENVEVFRDWLEEWESDHPGDDPSEAAGGGE